MSEEKEKKEEAVPNKIDHVKLRTMQVGSIQKISTGDLKPGAILHCNDAGDMNPKFEPGQGVYRVGQVVKKDRVKMNYQFLSKYLGQIKRTEELNEKLEKAKAKKGNNVVKDAVAEEKANKG